MKRKKKNKKRRYWEGRKGERTKDAVIRSGRMTGSRIFCWWYIGFFFFAIAQRMCYFVVSNCWWRCRGRRGRRRTKVLSVDQCWHILCIMYDKVVIQQSAPGTLMRTKRRTGYVRRWWGVYAIQRKLEKENVIKSLANTEKTIQLKWGPYGKYDSRCTLNSLNSLGKEDR